ncbi:hypothetical protein ScPMuIL_010548 [Solemya velum]
MADHFLFLVARLLLLHVMQQTVNCKQPHILFIVADDYGFNDIGYHGSEIRTPTLDKLASEGVRLENYYVQPICTPTRSQLLSGRYQIHTGLQHGIIWPEQPNGLPLDSPTIADKLKESGYSTHAVGKWHLGFYKKDYLPTSRGFDTYFGYLTGSEDYYTHYRCNGEPYDHSFCGFDLRNNTEPCSTEKGHYSTHMFTKRVVDIVSSHDGSKPLFVYLPFQAVHSPLQVPDEYIEPYKFIKNNNRRKYAGMVAAMDEAIANITKAFKAKGIWDDTLLIFTTDNGGQILSGGNNWPLRGWKASLWEGGVRAVGFAHGNMLQKKKRVSKALMHVTDWFPTLVNLAGGSLNGTKPLDGFDQWDALSAGGPSSRREILHNIDPLKKPSGESLYNNTFNTAVRAAIRVDSWKLITGDPGNSSWIPPPSDEVMEVIEIPTKKTKNVWLFNIDLDPNEKMGVSHDYPHVVKALLTRLAQLNATAVPARYPKGDPRSNPALRGGFWGPWM